MKLYTVCVHNLAVLVMSAGTQPPLPDDFATKPELIASLRSMDALLAGLPEEVRQGAEIHEIDEALDAWLGEDLLRLEHDGRPLWNGDRSQLSVREATVDEAAQWHSSYQEAVTTGEQDAGDEDWATYLVRVTDPGD